MLWPFLKGDRLLQGKFGGRPKRSTKKLTEGALSQQTP